MKTWSIEPSSEARIEVKLETEKNQVVDFSVVLIYLHNEEAETVILYDASHGEMDCHRFWKISDVKETKRFKERSKKEVFNKAYEDVKENWRRYIRLYKKRK